MTDRACSKRSGLFSTMNNPVSLGVNSVGSWFASRDDKCQHNLSLKVNQLPPEVLSDIFHFCRRDVLASVAFANFPAYDPFPHLLVHICRHWRDLALRTPTLWSSLRYTPDCPWFDTLLARSGGAPLTLVFELHAATIGPIQTLLEKNIHRICQLFVIDSLESEQQIPLALLQPALALENLYVLRKGLLHEGLVRSDGILSSQLFSGVMPRLRSLRLSTCNLDWRSVSDTHMASVHELTVECHPQLNGGGFTGQKISDILGSLAGMRQLRKLVLDYALPAEVQDEVGVQVELPQLNELSITSNEMSAAVLIHYLRWPPKVSLRLKIVLGKQRDVIGQRDRSLSIINRVCQHYEGNTSTQVRNFEGKRILLRGRGYSLGFRLRMLDHGLDHVPTRWDCKVSITFLYTPALESAGVISRACGALLKGLPLHALERFHIQEAGPITDNPWMQHVLYTPLLRHIVITDPETARFLLETMGRELDVLVLDIDEDALGVATVSEHPEVICRWPNLESMEFTGFELLNPSLASQLSAVLQARDRHGVPKLKLLEIRGSSVDTDVFQQLVVDLEVDEK
jgi:hypothetical protein